jgi:short subunit dehydrogenase-like uncharacterized protein
VIIGLNIDENWLLYGAYGYTGKLIIKEALKKGYRPTLAGRDESKLIPLANRLNLPYEVFSLKNGNLVIEKLKKYDLIFNAAGPFKYTSKPIVKACLKTRTHYLDITGELPVLERNLSLNKEAKSREIAIISGVGFDVVPSDCLVNYVAEKISNPIKMELAITGLGGSSPGTLKTMIEHLPKGIFFRRNGKLLTTKIGKNLRNVTFQDKERLVMQITWGDLATAYYSTGIPNIKTYMALPKGLILQFYRYGKMIQKLLSFSFIKKGVQKIIGFTVQGPNRYIRHNKSSYLWAEVENSQGQKANAWLKTLEAYRLTGISSIKAIEKVFTQNIIGALTPAQAFGSKFILEFPETELKDSLG